MKEGLFKQVLLKYENGSFEYCWIPEQFATREGRRLLIGKEQKNPAIVQEIFHEVRLKESQFRRDWNNNI